MKIEDALAILNEPVPPEFEPYISVLREPISTMVSELAVKDAEIEQLNKAGFYSHIRCNQEIERLQMLVHNVEAISGDQKEKLDALNAFVTAWKELEKACKFRVYPRTHLTPLAEVGEAVAKFNEARAALDAKANQ